MTTPLDAFAEICAHLGERPPVCEVRTADGQCGRLARFYAICHDCSHGHLCVSHEEAFRRQLAAGESAQCNRCGRVFPSIDAALTVIPL